MPQCPVCGSTLNRMEEHPDGADLNRYDCPRCGEFSLTGTVVGIIGEKMAEFSNGPAKLSHVLRKMSKREPRVLIDSVSLKHILQQTELPSPQEQLENLILWLGDHLTSPSAEVHVEGLALIAELGAVTIGDVGYVVEHAVSVGLVDGQVVWPSVGDGGCTVLPLSLTFNGWANYEELRRGRNTSRIAFMAMKFGDPELDRIYAEHFKPAVSETGFDLRRNDEEQQAGLIDDLMRVQIRQSRFLIADLTADPTHPNQGAYWEAGYAEGLSKPVIYTCRKNVSNDKGVGTHFDTNHHLTVVWEAENMPEAVRKLKATIRATLPGDAKMSDEGEG